MWIADNWKDYTVIDTSSGEKLEDRGEREYTCPTSQAFRQRMYL